MGISRIYQNNTLGIGQSVQLTEFASSHLCQVLRVKKHDKIILFNGQGGEYIAEMIECHRRRSTARVLEFIERKTESHCHIHLAQAISKGDRMDYAIQKAVELGVCSITPIITEYTNVRLAKERLVKRVAHWQAVAVSAAEQSGRCLLPEVMEPINVLNWLEVATDVKIIFDVAGAADFSKISLGAAHSVHVMIGPEGGFSEDELIAAKQAGFFDVRMGPRILRTETATVVAITLLQSRWGDLPQ